MKRLRANIRILIIAPVDLSRNDGPMVYFSNLAMHFRNLSAEVKCILYSPKESEFESLGMDIGVKFVPNPLLGNLFIRLLKYFLVIPAIVWDLFMFNPSLVYVEFSPPAFLYQLILRFLKLFPIDFNVAVEFHDWVSEQRTIQGENRFKTMIIEKLQVGSARLADYIRVVAKGIKERLLLFGINGRKFA